MTEKRKLWLQNNKERLNEYQKEYRKTYYVKNKKSIDEKNRNWAKNNREKMVKIVQKYVANNKEKVSNYNKGFNKTISGMFRHSKYGAKRRGYSFEITLEEFSEIIKNPCVYCGESEKRIGVDRIDNSKGYIKDNCAPCCTTCNMMKKDMGLDDFLSHIEKIFNHSKLSSGHKNCVLK